MSRQVIHWFPGHMKKALALMKERLRVVDLVIEIADARAPLASRDEELSSLTIRKDRLLVLAKSDLAEEEPTKRWLSYFKAKGEAVIAADLRDPSAVKKIIKAAKGAAVKKRARERKLGIAPQAIRALVAGVPNVGKSTLINRFAGKKAAPVANVPGFTKGERWIRAANGFDLLDTPGVLPSRYDDERKALRLALIGAIKRTILPTDLLARKLIALLRERYPGALEARYGIPEEDVSDTVIFEGIAGRRGFLKGNVPEIEKAEEALLTDFQHGRIVKCTLEKPPVEV